MEANAVFETEDQIKLIIACGQGHIWNVEDVKMAWTKYRIIGCLVGSLPRNPHQSSMMGLPLKLMPEEVTLLLEKRFAKPVTYPEMTEEPSSIIKNTFKQHRQKCYQEQIMAALQQRKHEIENIADTILEGKRKKFELRKKNKQGSAQNYNFLLTKEKVIEEEIRKIQTLPEHLQVIEVFAESPMVGMLKSEVAKWSFPTNNMEKLRYAVFKDLWEQNYYLTTGVKFGGDFLVYPGDPHLFHATFIVKCVMDVQCVDQCDLVSWSRIGTATKKTLVLATFDQSEQVSYKSYQWVENEAN
ncbi:hypothetical protein OTU49_009109 [Cherax quadricarinatus]|uniref:tRNA-splicing endonuclease subunit Sen34 n=1 Tax=Cherax quadricarinatus TaxID=27406 RepID=A0AAW0WN77_CHEQU|nr:tRNA-splicing endonuclease subunit Sen34-like [Cherax quadricarinatus]XP_053649541.1 tRNA-splicing endonuclease subunit Sen34-like [Cherax quadricarinatus]XP_053649542.1 tRNA-splicing endonuclease subunit Sen34-like [Cherax quadricarinatus]XP_053649543.1 tRNA-splicing endonuclease subunit Sen34-like [Cherax quadricarinatus]XP_053649545.1 tRNA-splicing endonuclease subunit Sen34-like [Cherax quadricarinatus]XP_053649546.1 tRNA-splicing endonuclease subunit Sen34-like [Cherax quadricarinatus]